MRVVPRNKWLSTPPNGTPERIHLPAPRLWLHHGAVGQSTVNTALSYANYHINNHGWLDVGYSFLIANGKVLEGRGAGRQGAHTQGDNTTSHGICMVGSYNSSLPSDADIDALVWLIGYGNEQNWWDISALTGGHRDATGATTSCPGDTLHNHIPSINNSIEENEMNEDDRRLLREVHAMLAGQFTDRNLSDDNRRNRLDNRAIGRALDLEIDPNGDPGVDIIS